MKYLHKLLIRSRSKVICDSVAFLFSSMSLIVGLEYCFAQTFTISSPDWPPFYILPSSIPNSTTSNVAEATGFAYEVSRICFSKLKLSSTWQEYPIKRMFREMETGQLDLNIMSFKADRLKSLNFGKEVVFTNSYVLWLRKGFQESITRMDQLDKLALADLVGLRTSDEYRRYLDQRLKRADGGNITVVSSVDSIASMLAAGRVDGAVISSAEMKFRLKKLGLSAQVKESSFRVKMQDYFFVAAKASPRISENPTILNQLDSCTKSLKSTGQWSRLKEKFDL